MFAARVDTNNIARLADNFKSDKKVLYIGILENKKYPDEGLEVEETITLNGKKRATPGLKSLGKGGKQTTAQVAFWNEYGTVNMPARPFMRNTVRAHAKEWGRILQGALQKGYTVEKALNFLGEFAYKDMVQTIEDGVPPANAPSTVAIKQAKGRADPTHTLVDSAYMQESIFYEVRGE